MKKQLVDNDEERYNLDESMPDEFDANVAETAVKEDKSNVNATQPEEVDDPTRIIKGDISSDEDFITAVQNLDMNKLSSINEMFQKQREHDVAQADKGFDVDMFPTVNGFNAEAPTEVQSEFKLPEIKQQEVTQTEQAQPTVSAKPQVQEDFSFDSIYKSQENDDLMDEYVEDEKQPNVKEDPRVRGSETTNVKVEGSRIDVYSPESEDEIFKIVEKTSGYTSFVLPSRGVLYAKDTGISDGIVWVRPMCADEEALMYNRFLPSRWDFVDRVIMSCCKASNNKPINPKLLTNGDMSYLCVALKSMTYGNSYPFIAKCDMCESMIESELDLDKDLENKMCEDMSIHEPFETVLPQCGIKVKFRIGRVKDTRAHNDYFSRMEDRMKEGTAKKNDASHQYLAKLVLAIVGKNQDFTHQDTIKGLIKKLSMRDLTSLFEAVMGAFPYGVNPLVDVRCPYCNHIMSYPLVFDQSFFSMPLGWNPNER